MSADEFLNENLVPERYRLLDANPVGRGAMGVVFKAWDTKLDRTVALKLLPAVSGGVQSAAPKPDIARAIQEARALAKVSHPGILQVFDVIEEKNRSWIVSEWLDGRALDKLVLPLHPASVAAILLQVLNALSAVHGTGIVHRDIKPSNIVLCASGRVVLLDFGVAFIPGGSSGATIAGTLRYCDPQRLEGMAPTQSSDLFSTALVGLELLTGTVVVPDLAPLPLHRFLTRELGSRLRECGEGHYPPLVSLFERMALNATAARPEGSTPSRNAQEISVLFHGFTSASPELFLLMHVVENQPVDDAVNAKIQWEINEALKNNALAPKTRAAWMAFLKTARTRFTPRGISRVGNNFKRPALWLLLVLGVVGTIWALFMREEKFNQPVAQVRTVPVVENVVSVTTPKVATPVDQPVRVATPAPEIKPSPNPTGKPIVSTPRPTVIATPSTVVVYFSANAWAVLYIDGKKEGQLPMADPLTLSTGRHRIRLENPMAETFEGVIEVSPSSAPLKHHFQLTPRSQN